MPRNKTPDWPLDMDRLIRGLRLRQKTPIHAVALLARVINKMGLGPAQAQAWTVRTTAHAPGHTDTMYVKEQDQMVLVWGNRLLDLSLNTQATTLLRAAHDELRGLDTLHAFTSRFTQIKPCRDISLGTEILESATNLAATLRSVAPQPQPVSVDPLSMQGWVTLPEALRVPVLHERGADPMFIMELLGALMDKGLDVSGTKVTQVEPTDGGWHVFSHVELELEGDIKVTLPVYIGENGLAFESSPDASRGRPYPSRMPLPACLMSDPTPGIDEIATAFVRHVMDMTVPQANQTRVPHPRVRV